MSNFPANISAIEKLFNHDYLSTYILNGYEVIKIKRAFIF